MGEARTGLETEAHGFGKQAELYRRMRVLERQHGVEFMEIGARARAAHGAPGEMIVRHDKLVPGDGKER